MSDDRSGDPLLDAASRAADGKCSQPEAFFDDDQRRIVENMSRIASLKVAFARVATDETEHPQALSEETPARWGHLCITGEIGRGGFGVVYRAFDPVLQREVALKLRREDHDRADAAAWIEEARRLARVRHPNVLAVHGADVNDGRVGMWSDLLEGVPLDVDLAVGGPLGRERLLAIAQQLASALDAIHRAGLVHGDVKAENVMLEVERAVLMDFGAGGQVGSRPRYGSPATMAPELLDGGRATAAADLYSLGALLFRLAIGRRPEFGRQVDQRVLRAKLGRPLAALIVSLLAVPAEQRPSAAQLLQGIARIQALPRRRRRRLALAAVIGSLLVGLGMTMVGMQRARVAQVNAELERQRAEAVNAFLVDVLAAPQATREGERVRVVELLDQAVARLERGDTADSPQVQADLWQVLGRSFDALERRDDALAALERAHGLRALLHGPLDPRTLEVERLRAEAGAHNSQPQPLIEQLRPLHARALVATGPDHPLPALIAARIGREHTRAGELDEARQWLEPVYQARATIQWQHALDRAAVEIHWLHLLQRLGDVDAMLEGARAVRTLVESQAGERHANALIARNLEIGALLQQGRLPEAEQAARAQYELTSVWLGEDNRLTLTALGSLASAVSEQGRTSEAAALHERIYAAQRRRLGADDAGTLVTALNLANALRANGDSERASVLYHEVIAGLPQKNDAAMLARSNLAELQIENGDYAVAHATAKEALALMETALGTDHLFTQHARTMLGAAERGLGRPQAALPLLERGATGIEGYLGERHLVTLEARFQLALVLLELGQRERAVELLEGVAAARHEQLGSAHAKTRAAREALDRAGRLRG